MRDVGGETPFARLGRRERGDLGLECSGHLVERLRPDAELVPALDRQARLQQALRKRPRRAARLRDGSQRPARERPADQRGEHDQDADADQQDVPQVGELVPDLLLGEEEVELRVAARAADDQVARPGDSLPLVADVSVTHDLAERGGHLARALLEARRERPARPDPHGLEAAAGALVGLEQGVWARLQIRGCDLEVRARLPGGAVDRVGEEVVADDEVRARREGSGGEADRKHERDRQAAPEGHQPASRR